MKIICTSEEYKKESIVAAMERNDCFVRAIASAFEVKYEEAHSYIRDIFNRKDGEGTYGVGVYMSMKNVAEVFGKQIEKVTHEDELWEGKQLKVKYRMRGKWKVGGYTTISFLKKFPTGTYILVTHNHAFTIKDGVIYGNKDDGDRRRARIESAWKVG